MSKPNYNKDDMKVINWNELSNMIEGEPGVVRSNFVPTRHKKEVDKLMAYITRFCQKNRKSVIAIPRVSIVIGNSTRTVKKPPTVENGRSVKELPKNAEKVSNSIFGSGDFYYSYLFSIKNGKDIREWYELTDAQQYVSEQLKKTI